MAGKKLVSDCPVPMQQRAVQAKQRVSFSQNLSVVLKDCAVGWSSPPASPMIHTLRRSEAQLLEDSRLLIKISEACSLELLAG